MRSGVRVAAAVAFVAWLGSSAANATLTTPPLQFSVPGRLPDATVGKPYQFSFCQPAPKAGSRCGKPSGATNPSGGYGHYYVFSLHLSLPPPGLRLSERSGLLRGTLSKAGSYRFTVCVKDAERRPGVAPKPSCKGTRLNGVAPPPPPPPPVVAQFGGVWNGRFQTTSVAANSCGSSASGSVQFTLTQTGNKVTGNMTYNVTGFTVNPNPAPNCANLAQAGTTPVDAAVAGNTLTGSGFTLTKTSDTALSGTFSGAVQGFQLTVNITVP